MKSENQTQDEHGNWVDAVEEPYYPSLWDKIWCFLGVHETRHKLTYGHIIRSIYYCVKCGKITHES